MVFHPDPSKEFYFDEDCYIIELLNDSSNPDISIARARVLPQVKTKHHALRDTMEYYQIISGTGMVFIGDNSFIVSPGDLIKIDHNVSQAIKNIGESDLIFLCICQPRFVPNNYIDLEETP